MASATGRSRAAYWRERAVGDSVAEARARESAQAYRDALAESVWGECPECGRKVLQAAFEAPEWCIRCSTAPASVGLLPRRSA